MNLVLTFDYELFGDGSGDVFEHMIKPTRQIFDVCDEYDIKTTIFFEVVEYWRLKEEWDDGNKMGYNRNPIEAIEQQLQKAAQNGHDIQLHVHPQWVNAEWKGKEWKLDMSNWRLGDLSTKDYSIERLLREGKEAIESLIREVVRDYKCIALRAGAYNIMPSEDVYKAMNATGLKVDSSVYPGGFEHGELSKYDYRGVSLDKDYWWADPADIRKESQAHKEIMEIPVFALPQRRIHKLLNTDKIHSLLFEEQKNISLVAKEKMSERSIWGKFKFLFGKEAFTWDFCLFSNYLHKKFYKYTGNELSNQRDTFVIIGHPKSYQSNRSLKALLKLAKKSKFSFITLKEAYENFNN
jgi:peptidoglycan/xylan/chitin deacetylase (PgdA/CDA1 family)